MIVSSPVKPTVGQTTDGKGFNLSPGLQNPLGAGQALRFPPLVEVGQAMGHALPCQEEELCAAEIMEAPGRFVLTVAHLDHDPWNPNPRLKVLCSPCHCRYDISPEQMARKRKAKLEFIGQLNLLEGFPCKD